LRADRGRRRRPDAAHLGEVPDVAEQSRSTSSYAIVSETFDIGADVPQWVIDELIGTVRITSDSDRPVLVGIASEGDVEPYLGNVRRAVV
jgi:hypothetical protein